MFVVLKTLRYISTDELPHLKNAISGRGAWDVIISVRHSCSFPTLLLIPTILAAVTWARDLRMTHMVKATLRGQLWELREEPVAVFEETILVDRVEIVPVLICPAVVFLCKEEFMLPWLQIMTKGFHKRHADSWLWSIYTCTSASHQAT